MNHPFLYVCRPAAELVPAELMTLLGRVAAFATVAAVLAAAAVAALALATIFLPATAQAQDFGVPAAVSRVVLATGDIVKNDAATGVFAAK